MPNKQVPHIAALFFVLALLSVATPFLHNHEADLHEHEDCIAYLLTTIFSLGIIAVFFFQTLISIQIRIFFLRTLYITFFLYGTHLTRAPPFFS